MADEMSWKGALASVLILAALVLPAACGKRSEPLDIDQEMAERLYLACVAQPAAMPSDCRYNAEILSEKRKP